LTRGNKIILIGSGAIAAPYHQTEDKMQRCRQLYFSQDWCLELKQTSALVDFQSKLWHGHGYAVSDGSYKNGNGAAAWIIEGWTAVNRLKGTCFTPGGPNDHSSFHGKLAGILGVLHVLSFWRSPTGRPPCRIACDGKSVINRLSSPRPIKPTEPHFDLLQAVRTMINTCGFTIQLVFVHGHQDNGVPTVLMRDAHLNIEAVRWQNVK